MTRSIQHSPVCGEGEMWAALLASAPAALAKHEAVVLAVAHDDRMSPRLKELILAAVELFATDRFDWDLWADAAPEGVSECFDLVERMRALNEPIPFTLAEGGVVRGDSQVFNSEHAPLPGVDGRGVESLSTPLSTIVDNEPIPFTLAEMTR